MIGQQRVAGLTAPSLGRATGGGCGGLGKNFFVLFETILRAVRVPGAMRHSSCRFAEPGPYQTPAFVTAPVLQRTASQELRAALRPGHNNHSCAFSGPS